MGFSWAMLVSGRVNFGNHLMATNQLHQNPPENPPQVPWSGDPEFPASFFSVGNDGVKDVLKILMGKNDGI